MWMMFVGPWLIECVHFWQPSWFVDGRFVENELPPMNFAARAVQGQLQAASNDFATPKMSLESQTSPLPMGGFGW